MQLISTHTLTWSVTCIISWKFGNHTFQLTRSRGAWRKIFWRECYSYNFNSHAHVERDVFNLVWGFSCVWFQLTRSRGAWRDTMNKVKLWLEISTHTLTWSVTFEFKIIILLSKISTHTLTWSVTICQIHHLKPFRISTHTLTWSVTKSSCNISRVYKFQLTRSRGAWRVVYWNFR